jgi:arylsulfatase A-like enzyme
MAKRTKGADSRPNILLVTCDQYRFPRFSYGPDGGFDEALKQVLGFQGGVDESNPYAKFFPGLLKLRDNAVILRNHTIAASACTPSRAVIYTGQYGTRTGVTQTDGLFKNGDSPNFPWLEAGGIPTLGTWLRAAGYTTHYFGKWHVSNPPDHSLEAYGFDNWEESYPEPHGAQYNNLGIYRDAGFTDSACAFLRRQGLASNYNRAYASMAAEDPDTTGPDVDSIPPWFAVASFTNPHDIATYPGVVAQALPDPDSKTGTQSIFGPLTVPPEGSVSPPPVAGTIRIPLNPGGFPQDCARPSPTQSEDLAGKPTCQHEAAYKVGLALAAKGGFNIVNGLMGAIPDGAPQPSGDHSEQAAVALSLKSCIPLQLAEDPDSGCRLFLQLYAWLHSVVDAHIDAVLEALEQSGQADNTIVLFLADHGEYGAAHGMMIEKWYTAYQEALHVPVVVRFPKVAVTSDCHSEPAQLDILSSHIDILPTILGFAGVGAAERAAIAEELRRTRPVPPLPGVDLSGIIEKALTDDRAAVPVIEPDGEVREGVLFITDDEITAPLPPSDSVQSRHSDEEFALYRQVVDAVREGRGKGPVALAPGAVRQPNHVRAVRTRDWKLARYFDPSGETPQEWEMYDLRNDPNEAVNLVEVAASPPRARADLRERAKVQACAEKLAALLARLEARDL